LNVSSLPWASQDANQQAEELLEYLSSRGSTREERRARKKRGVGSATSTGDQLMQQMMATTVRRSSTGEPFVDRAALGQGKPQWYALAVSMALDLCGGHSVHSALVACYAPPPACNRF
jgi:hypothetical protein